MSVTRGKFVVVAVLVFMGLTLSAGPSLAQKNVLELQALCPESIVPGTAFNISLKITNNTDYNIAYDRVTLTAVNKDMSFQGPVEGVIAGSTLTPGQSIRRNVSFTLPISSEGPSSGEIAPIIINLFRIRLSTDSDSFRGMVLTGAKVQ